VNATQKSIGRFDLLADEEEICLFLAVNALRKLRKPKPPYLTYQEVQVLLLATKAPHTMDTCYRNEDTKDPFKYGEVIPGLVRHIDDPDNERGQLFLHLQAREPLFVPEAVAAIRNEFEKRCRAAEFPAMLFIIRNHKNWKIRLRYKEISERIKHETQSPCTSRVVDNAVGELKNLKGIAAELFQLVPGPEGRRIAWLTKRPKPAVALALLKAVSPVPGSIPSKPPQV